MPAAIRRRSFLARVAGSAVLATTRLHALADGRDVPWLAEVQRPPKQLPPDLPRLRPLLRDPAGRPIRSLAQWEAQRRRLRQWWLEFLEPLPVERRTPPELEVLEEDRVQTPGWPDVLRQRVRYQVEPEVWTEAYLLKPAERRGRVPGVAVFHSTVAHSIRQPAGVEGKPEKAFGLKLAQRGCVTFCPRNFLWPDNHHIAAQEQTERFQKRHPGHKGMAKMLFDAQVAVDILASLPEVDARRLGALGHSLGGKEVLYLAAFDERVKVTVSSEGGIGTTYSNWDAPWYLGPAVRRPGFQHEHHELLALVAPRPFLLIGGDSADGDRSWPFIEAVLPVYRLYGGTPRLGLFNHHKGHAVPPEAERRLYEWFATYL